MVVVGGRAGGGSCACMMIHPIVERCKVIHLWPHAKTGRTGVASMTGSQFDTQVEAPRIKVVLRNVDGWRSSMTGSAGGEDMESPRGKAAGMDDLRSCVSPNGNDAYAADAAVAV
jgi:hypothetical protein